MKRALPASLVALALVGPGCLLEPWSWRDARDARPGDVSADTATRADAITDADVEPPPPDVEPADAPDAPDAPPAVPDDLPCPEGTSRCGAACVALSTDPAHCGACETSCRAPAHAAAACVRGACSFVCEAGARDCDGEPGDGCEALTAADPANCGGCGRACPAAPHARPSCAMGACAVACEAGWGDCDGDASNGCEAGLAADARHCGRCGAACAGAPGASPTCASGRCGVACDPGRADCDRDPANGCEALTASDPAHCGACGNACPAGQLCSRGACARDCQPGELRCGAACVSAGAPTSCGSCANACPARPHASPTCAAGACGIACDAGWADCDRDPANGCEASVSDDPRRCGACATACPTPNGASAACRSGVCGFACAEGQADCDRAPGNGCEVDTRASASHCGACGNACPAPANASPACAAGRCGFSCNAGFADCDRDPANGCEADTRTSASHCAACGNACPAPPHGVATCAAGSCRAAAQPGWADCDAMSTNGFEVNTAADPANCGACGARCAFANASATCAGGACAPGACNAGFADCDHNPANGCEARLADDGANCGACGRACPAGQFCSAGACAVRCDAPSLRCTSGTAVTCVAPGDVANCGGCGVACRAAPSATAVCVGATCALSCVSGRADCDGDPANGCEAAPATAVAHCGRCGNACPAAPNASATCAGGVCGYACNAGWGDCDGGAANGCEVDLRATPSSCGACGTACPARANATATCAAGACGFACAAGFADCDGSAANGCEANLRTDPAHCGTCATACPAPAGATAACVAGACGVGPCRAGFASCDGSPANGCEVSVATDPANCGACGARCAFANASAACVGGACALGACNAGFADCDRNPANGCEVALATDGANCGACGTRCDAAAGSRCSGGRCGSVCGVGELFCAGSCAATATSLAHCGGCGNACPTPPHGAAGCAGGVCGVASCASGWADCNGAAADGCEVSVLVDNGNCGRCGAPCPVPPNAAPVCRAGSCGYTCNPGWVDCDGAASNGCEAATTALTSCGGCGVTCARANAAATCATGACAVASCAAAWGNCDGGDANGCETALTTTSNCGACGRSCPAAANASATCAGGACGIACGGLYRNCDGDASNGCEVLANTATNCGACGRACSLPHARVSCSTGACQLTGCLTGYADEDGVESNGCEARVTICTCPRCPINSFCDRVTCSCESLGL